LTSVKQFQTARRIDITGGILKLNWYNKKCHQSDDILKNLKSMEKATAFNLIIVAYI
jgi:hypothetical protein